MIIKDQKDLDFALNNGMPVVLYGRYFQLWRDVYDSDNHWGQDDDINHFIAVTGKSSETEYIVNDPMYKNGAKIMTYNQLRVFFEDGKNPRSDVNSLYSYGLYWKPIKPFTITKSNGIAYIFVRNPSDNLLYFSYQDQPNGDFCPFIKISNFEISGNPVAIEQSTAERPPEQTEMSLY